MDGLALVLGYIVMASAGTFVVGACLWGLIELYYKHAVIAEDFIRFLIQYKKQQREGGDIEKSKQFMGRPE